MTRFDTRAGLRLALLASAVLGAFAAAPAALAQERLARGLVVAPLEALDRGFDAPLRSFEIELHRIHLHDVTTRRRAPSSGADARRPG